MMFYIVLIAILNLGLGFMAAVYLGRGYNRPAAVSSSRNNISLDSQAGDLGDSGAHPRETAPGESRDGGGNDADDLVGVKAGRHSTVGDEFSADLDALFQ